MATCATLQTIRTPRLTLRALRPDDARAIAEGVGNYEVARWLSVVPYPYGLDEARAYIAAALETGDCKWAICTGDDVIGAVAYTDHLGYWLARDAWGAGFATEACDAVVDHLFDGSQRDELVSSVFLGNGASGRVLRKAGFLPTGRRRIPARALRQDVEAETLALTRSRWQNRRRFRISTPRLTLRETRCDDWRALQSLGGVPEVARMLTSVTLPWTDDAVRAGLARARFRGRPGFGVTICAKDGTILGSAGLDRPAGATDYNCFCWLGRSFWGAGIATEAMQAFLRECFLRFPEIDRICADHFTDNPASARILRKLGFHRIGTAEGRSPARLEPAPVILYRVTRDSFGVSQ